MQKLLPHESDLPYEFDLIDLNDDMLNLVSGGEGSQMDPNG
jgi:hypothetical protein